MEQPEEPSSGAPGRLRPWTLPGAVWAAVALGLAVRLHLVLIARPTCEPYESGGASCRTIGGDALYFFLQGKRLAAGDLYVDPLVTDRNVPGAGDPPIFAGFLAFLNKLGIDTPQGQRVATAVVGALGIVLIALVAGRLAGRRAAVITAVLAAVYPMLWINDGQLMSESLYIPLVAVALLACLQVHERPSVGRAMALGAAIALAALTRGEALAFLAFIAVPLVLAQRRQPLLRRLAVLGVVGAAAAVVLAPWFLFNLSRFAVPSTMSSQTGSVLLSSACDRGYEGDLVGYYSFDCLVIPLQDREPVPLDSDKSVEDATLRRHAQAYIGDHLGDLPRVAFLRVGRAWDLYRPSQGLDLNVISEGRGRAQSEAGLGMYYALLPFAIGGLVLLRRRRLPISPFLGMAVTASVVAAATFGVTRYRVPVDVCLVVLAGVALDAAWERWKRGALPREDRGPRPPDEVAAEVEAARRVPVGVGAGPESSDVTDSDPPDEVSPTPAR